MEKIFEILVSGDGRTMVAWDPNAQTNAAEADIREPKPGDGYTQGEDPQAIADAFQNLALGIGVYLRSQEMN